MRVEITKITSAINKISDLTSGDKIIPGVMLTLSENKLDVCYSDGNKSFIETLEVETDETDRMGSIVVELKQIQRAVSNCQPSGIIKVSDIYIKYNEKTITVSADQIFERKDAEGNIVDSRKLAKKSMDILWVEPGASMKTSILNRMKYDDIFESDGLADEFDKAELMDALAKTSVEKGKQIYFSVKTQHIFVANQAHLTSVPISGFGELSMEDQDIIRAELSEAGTLTDENFKAAVENRKNRMHYSVCINQAVSKALIGVLGKTNADKVYLHTKDKACNIYIDSEDERVGIWFEMAQASKIHLGTLERYSALQYTTHQLTFIREFLADSVKSALNSSNGDKTAFKFIAEEDGLKLVIACGSASASISDTYKILVDDAKYTEENSIVDKTFNVSLKVFSDMLAQLKTTNVALDFECSADGSASIRLAEIDEEKMMSAYNKMRDETAKRVGQSREVIDDMSNPVATPLDIRMSFRSDSLGTKQYTMLAK